MKLTLKRREIPDHLMRFFTSVGHKPKDLIDTPSMLAEALRADGWYLRSAIVWNKLAPMPESTKDRPTSAHEMIYLFAKQSRYFYDATAVRTPQTGGTHGRGTKAAVAPKVAVAGEGIKNNGSFLGAMTESAPADGFASLRNVWTLSPEPGNWDFCDSCRRLFVGTERTAIKQRDGQRVCPCGASDFVAHYATFPSEIPRRAIRAGTSAKGCCPACGAGWVRQTERTKVGERVKNHRNYAPLKDTGNHGTSGFDGNGMRYDTDYRLETRTTGWQPGCAHCSICDKLGLSADQGRIAHAAQGSGTRESLAPRVEQEAMGNESGAPRKEPCETAKIPEGLRAVRCGILGEVKDGAILQSAVLGQSNVGERSSQPAASVWDGTVQAGSESGQGGQGAPEGDGGASRQAALANRVCPSHQRGEGRQPNREPCGVVEEGACPDPREEAAHDLTPYDPIPCLTLDIFSGSGTTGRVARQLGRRYLGLELSDRYANASEALLARETRPLFDDLPIRTEQLPLLAGGE